MTTCATYDLFVAHVSTGTVHLRISSAWHLATLIDQLPIGERLVWLRNISDLLIIDVESGLPIRPPDIVVDVVQVGVCHESSHIASFLHAEQLRSIVATTCCWLDHQGLQGWIIAPLWHVSVSDEVEALHLERPL